MCSFKVGPGCHCDNADLATGSVRCHTSRVPLESARCSTVIRRIIHDLCVYKQFHSIRSCKFNILSLDKYLKTFVFLLSTFYTLVLCSFKVGPGCHCDNADLATGSVRCHTSRVPLESARCSTVIRRIIHDLCVYKQFHSIRSCKFNILSLDKYLKTFVFLLSTFYTLVLCSFKVGPGCHCDNADLATGSVRCHTSRVPLESARCRTVIRRIIHDLGVYKQCHSIRSCTFYILSLDKYL